MYMDIVSVVEFLSCVPLLERLQNSSLQKIAQLVAIKNYDCGEYVLREGEAGDGIYFIWDGEADACGNFQHVIDENPTEFHLKRYDYFGHGLASLDHHGEVIAFTKLTCLVLPHEHRSILQPKSISNQLMEQILHLEPIGVNIFRGVTLPDAPTFVKMFGGQFIGQSLTAAAKTVDPRLIVHSLHANFFIAGDIHLPIAYQVHHARDGKRFSTRRVDAMQNGKLVFSLIASFQKEEKGFEHQYALMPSVPDPETLLSLDDIHESRLTDLRLPRTYRNKLATTEYIPWPIEVRFCDPSTASSQTKTPPSLRHWFRAKGKLSSDDQALHRCVVAYASDLMICNIMANPHRRKGLKMIPSTLNHSMWFHRPVRADDWLLFVVHTPAAYKSRGFVRGQMFNKNGELVASVGQEGFHRIVDSPKSAVQSKL